MLNKLKKDNKGFTIIEVMIVLAIAGLIILIVLLAIPALQRNGRNTQVKNDASAVSAGVAEYKSNNDGQPPNSITSTTVSGAAGSNVTIKVSGGVTVSATNNPNTGDVGYSLNTACPGSTSGSKTIAIWYKVENSGGSVVKCIDA